MLDNAITHQTCTVMGDSLHYLLRKGSDANAPTLMLLHGFPECAEAWLPVLAALPAEYTVIMPDLPGFGESAPPSSEAGFQVSRLVERLARFIDTVSDTAVHLTGHDWGGALAWPLAAFHPQKVATLTIINAAHPSTFLRELKYNPRQREKSIYINTLNKQGAALELAGRDFRLLKRIMGHSLRLSGEDYACQVEANWRNTQKLDAMLGYYRNMPQGVPLTGKDAASLVIPELHVPQPVSVLWGWQDEAFDPGVLDGLSQWVCDLRVTPRDEATHWLHREYPEWVANQLVIHVDAHR